MKKRNLLFSKERSVTKVTKWKLSWSEVKFSVSQEELTMNLFMTEKGGKMKNVVFNSCESNAHDGSRKENASQISLYTPDVELKNISDDHKPYGYNRRYGFEVMESDYSYPVCHDPYFPCMDTSPVICDSVKVCHGLLGGGDNKGNSEPGPSSNTSKKGGRRRKVKGFRGTPVLENNTQESLLLSYSPIPLQNNFVPNQGLENTCFANSAFQALFSFPNFVNFVQIDLPRPTTFIANSIKDLCLDMCTSPSVHTFEHVRRLTVPGYTPYNMFDSHEFLIHILNEVYPSIEDNCIFKVGMFTSISCTNTLCNHTVDSIELVHHIPLPLDPNQDVFSTKELLMGYQLREHMDDYKCDSCNMRNMCYKESTISDTSEVIVLQLKAFNYINGIAVKNTSTILVDSELDDFYGKQYSLHSVIYHDGTSVSSGHYTCKVKYNDNWIAISDSKISYTSDPSVFSSNATPYVVFYKRTDNSDIVSNICAEPVIPVIEDSPEQVSPLRKKVHFNFEQQDNVNNKAYDDDIDFMKENVSSNSHDQAIQNYCEAQNVQNVCNLLKGKQNLINELNYQASKVMNAKAEQSKKLSNLMGKKRKSCQTDAQRKKISRTNQTPEKKEQEKKADQARKQDIRSTQTPEKRNK